MTRAARDRSPDDTPVAGLERRLDLKRVMVSAVEGFGGNQAALAAELGVTRATVSRWISGQSIPDEGSCLRLAKLTGRAPVDVFRLAGRDANLLPTQPELLADAALAARLRQWANRISGLSAAERAIALNVLDDMVKSLCHRFGGGERRQEVGEVAKPERRRDRDSGPLGGLPR